MSERPAITEAKKGSAELLILALVDEQDRHGYDIARLIEARSAGTLTFTLASLYASLYRLEARGWIRGAKGHLPLDGDFKFKEGDGPAFALHCQTTDKLLLAAADGRFYTLGADKLPGARGFGEPVRNMVDVEAEAQIVGLVVHRPGGQLLVASRAGKGFAAPMDEILAETRKGRQVVNLKTGSKLAVAREIAPGDDHVAVVGENRKLVIFALDELPVMARGQGVTLQRYRDGGLSDATSFTLAEGLSWTMGGESGRTRTETEIGMWKVARGAAGRLPPQGFPKDNRF